MILTLLNMPVCTIVETLVLVWKFMLLIVAELFAAFKLNKPSITLFVATVAETGTVAWEFGAAELIFVEISATEPVEDRVNVAAPTPVVGRVEPESAAPPIESEMPIPLIVLMAPVGIAAVTDMPFV